MPNALTWLFLAALLAASATRLWLALRQIRHVRAHRDAVPPSFAGSIPLHAHQKAADYTAAKTRFGAVDTLVGALLVLLLTLAVALGIPLLLAVLWLMARMGEHWWLYVWLLITAFGLAFQLIFPPLILPLFNKFTPITEGELAARVAALLERCGFKSRGLYKMDGSKRSSHGNAFFAGIGATKRIVLFDTLIDRLDPSEVEAVLAHELGHYKLHHVVKMVALSAAMSLAGLWILGQLIDRPWFYAGLGVSTPSTAAALALFMLVVPEFMFFVQPPLARYSRKREFEADAYAKGYAEPSHLARALVKLYHDNAATLTPDPLHSAFYDSHPPAAMRIARLEAK